MNELDDLLPPQAPAAGKQKTQVKHLIVVVPGIAGSALRGSDGRLLWALTPGVVRRPIRNIEELTRAGDDLADPDYRDGVEPYDLMALPVPGLTRLLGGYRELRAALFGNFELTDGLTYLEFPYDWRRPIAFNAARLATCVRQRLDLVRATFGQASVIIVGHSMGGLVGTEYVAHHGGHEVVRKLITLGTPFRGAPKALDFLVNGPKYAHVRFRKLAGPLGRIPSMYELLPIYPLIGDPGDAAAPLRSIAEMVPAFPILDQAKVVAASEFLTALNESAQPLLTHPLVGFGTPTVQQAVIDGTMLRAEREAGRLPPGYQHEGGDGTVPAAAATPRSHERAGLLPAYQNQTHGGLVTGRETLGALVSTLRAALRDGPVLDPGDLPPGQPPDLANTRMVSLDTADFYPATEAVRVAGSTRLWPPQREIWYQLDGEGPRTRVTLADDGSFAVDLGPLAEGVYRLDLVDGPAGEVLLSDVVEVG